MITPMTTATDDDEDIFSLDAQNVVRITNTGVDALIKQDRCSKSQMILLRISVESSVSGDEKIETIVIPLASSPIQIGQTSETNQKLAVSSINCLKSIFSVQ